MDSQQRKQFLDSTVDTFNRKAFIQDDPISIPHLFAQKQDLEIAGLWTALISWGQRKTILRSAHRLMEWMGNEPYRFVMEHREIDRKPFLSFVHRTFNGEDACRFLEFFQRYYHAEECLEQAFTKGMSPGDAHVESALVHFRTVFEQFVPDAGRTLKHVSTPLHGSRCKRLLMFLRWMVRKDEQGVDFGIWPNISPAQLLMPLDVHVDRVARKLGLLTRKQCDWKAVLELTEQCSKMDPKDPVRYDFALFCLGLELHSGDAALGLAGRTIGLKFKSNVPKHDDL